jgi:pimeloyl-ACP methyl ester carboxylesterase
MTVQVVLVHGIRTSASMWRAQLATLAARGIPADAIDLPGHGTRMSETFTLEEAFSTIDRAVRAAAERGPVLLVGHSMGGLLCTEYAGSADRPPIAGFIAASCTSIPRGVGLRTYRVLARSVDALPDRGMWLTKRMLAATLPEHTRADFGAGGYAFDTQDLALSLLATLDIAGAVARIRVPLWFVNGQYDQLRLHERLFTRLAPHAELIVVPRTSHLVSAMRPSAFDAVIALAVATLETEESART